MPRVPTILADETLRFTPQGESNPLAFNEAAGFGEVAQGLRQLSAGATSLAHNMRYAEQKAKQDRDNRWVGDSLYGELMEWNAWQSRPENHTSEEYAENFRKFAEPRISQFMGAAPSPEAAQGLKARLQASLASRDAENWNVTMRTRVGNTRDSIVSQTANAMDLYRSSVAIPGANALEGLTAAGVDIKDRIDKFFSGDQESARKMRGYVDTEMALAIAPNDPAAARRLAKATPDITEEHRQVLLNKIDTISKDTDQIAKDTFNRQRADTLAMAELGKPVASIPLKDYEAHFDHADAVKHKTDDDMKLRIFSTADRLMSRIAPMSAAFQDNELGAIKAATNDLEGKMVLEYLVKKTRDVQELQAKDRVSWLRQFNPEVMGLDKQLASTPTGPARDVILNARNSSILKYQGFPPPKDPHPEYYLGLATTDRSLMTHDQALANATYINQGTPGEVVSRINEMLAEYPDKQASYVAFSDMVSGLPKTQAIRPEYQLVWQNKDQWWVQNYVQAISDTKANSQLTDDRKRDLDKRIDANKSWRLFEDVMVRGLRSDEAAAFKQGVAAFANYFMASQGDKPEVAAKKSVDLLINTTLGFTSVHGRALMILKDRDIDDFGIPQPPRTEDEVKDIGRRLETALRDLDPRAIDQSRFTALTGVSPDEKNIDRLQALRDIVTQRGFFVTENDGQSATLYIDGDQGIAFQIRDHDNRAFQVYFDDLPQYMVERRTMLPGGYLIRQEPAPIERTYPIRGGYGPGVSDLDAFLGIAQKQNNWPSGGPFRRTDMIREPGAGGTPPRGAARPPER